MTAAEAAAKVRQRPPGSRLLAATPPPAANGLFIPGCAPPSADGSEPLSAVAVSGSCRCGAVAAAPSWRPLTAARASKARSRVSIVIGGQPSSAGWFRQFSPEERSRRRLEDWWRRTREAGGNTPWPPPEMPHKPGCTYQKQPCKHYPHLAPCPSCLEPCALCAGEAVEADAFSSRAACCPSCVDTCIYRFVRDIVRPGAAPGCPALRAALLRRAADAGPPAEYSAQPPIRPPEEEDDERILRMSKPRVYWTLGRDRQKIERREPPAPGSWRIVKARDGTRSLQPQTKARLLESIQPLCRQAVGHAPTAIADSRPLQLDALTDAGGSPPNTARNNSPRSNSPRSNSPRNNSPRNNSPRGPAHGQRSASAAESAGSTQRERSPRQQQ
eukprot:TRINITY_DN11245_c0_g1_i1.p1 TRINITY_DN11245_c0_g1~~TRINITY_DN11245_c0_g1_i1.p1  ORF type:complete len:436 (+),score=77.53 TRINITY_DN11245_c0_g1_i1:152-1309(+)